MNRGFPVIAHFFLLNHPHSVVVPCLWKRIRKYHKAYYLAKYIIFMSYLLSDRKEGVFFLKFFYYSREGKKSDWNKLVLGHKVIDQHFSLINKGNGLRNKSKN